MRRLFFTLTAALFLFPLTASASAPRPTPAPLSGRPVSLAGSLLPTLKAARRLALLPGKRTLSLSIDLRVRNQAELDGYLAVLYDPRSPFSHHFLSVRQFVRRFAPPAAERDRVTSWLRSQGLQVVSQSANGLEITVEGRVSRIEQSFGTRLYTYQEGKERFYANAQVVKLPAAVAAVVVSVSGLNDQGRERPQIARSEIARLGSQSHAHREGQALTPQDIATAYDLQPLYHQEITGNGTTIALVEYADYDPNDIATYDSQFGINGNVERVAVGTARGSGAGLGEGQDECELDIEMANAVAPDAHVLVYEAPNNSAGTLAMWNQIVSDNRAQTVSTSWGKQERSWSKSSLQAVHQVFEEAAVQGQTIFVASGDQGAFDGVGKTVSSVNAKKKLMVDYPASDPWVTSVGGTTLRTNGDGTYNSESAWSNADDPDNVMGSGGGLSTVFKRPAYQQGPGVANRFSNGYRQVPDVAANADPATGYAIYTVNHGTANWQKVGGTSASAPLWAAYTLLANQYLQQPVGFFNPTLYALGQQAGRLLRPPFHDVTSGNNRYYPATPGWDFATGWGSMDGAALVQDIQTIGGIVKVQLPTVDFSLEAEMAFKDHGQLVGVTQINRGQTVYVLVSTTLGRIASDSDAQVKVNLALKGHSIFRRTVTAHFLSRDVGQRVQHTMRLQVPRSAARGTYTLTVTQTMQGVTEQVSTKVRVH